MLITVAPVTLILSFQGSALRWFSVVVFLKKFSAIDFFYLKDQTLTRPDRCFSVFECGGRYRARTYDLRDVNATL